MPGWTVTPRDEVPWTMPPKGTMLQRNDAMQAESSLKRPRESGDKIGVKEAPMSGPPRGSEGVRIPTFKAPPIQHQKAPPPPPPLERIEERVEEEAEEKKPPPPPKETHQEEPTPMKVDTQPPLQQHHIQKY